MVMTCIHSLYSQSKYLAIHRRLIYKEHTSTYAEGADPRVWGLARAGLRVACPPAISHIHDHVYSQLNYGDSQTVNIQTLARSLFSSTMVMTFIHSFYSQSKYGDSLLGEIAFLVETYIHS